MADSLSTVSKNLALDAFLSQGNNGFLRLYDGTMPASADASLSGNTLLAELTFGATAFAVASGGSAATNAITRDESANAGGTATFARLYKSDATTCFYQLDPSHFTVTPSLISAGQPVEVSTGSIGF